MGQLTGACGLLLAFSRWSLVVSQELRGLPRPG
jgi:hypothetical protein